MTIFPKHSDNALQEPHFLGRGVNVARYDQQRFPIYESLNDKQIAQFWRPEEIDLSRDRIDFGELPEHEKHIFVSNLKYQILLDSVQGRSPAAAFMSITSLPEIEGFIDSWQFFESIHSRSYTHIIRNVFNEPSAVFDSIMVNDAIMARADAVCGYYDSLIEYNQLVAMFGYGDHVFNGVPRVLTKREHMKKIYLCLMCVNILEAVRFYVSFACAFAFAERGLMEGNAKIIKLIARDEAVHLSFTQHILNRLASGEDGSEWASVAEECMLESFEMFYDAAEQEKEWAKYLFKDGTMVGLNYEILATYVEYITNLRMMAVGLPKCFNDTNSNPIPWVNAWLTSDNVQVAPQEVEISSYLIGQVDAEIDPDAFEDMEI